MQGGQALVEDSRFLLSLPQFSLAAELRATLDLLYGPDAQAVCRFPARYLWLKRQLALPALPALPVEACEDLAEFKARAPIDTLSLVFASETLSHPSSMMGHLFLKLSGRVADSSVREHAVSFFTEPVSLNLPKVLYDSLVGGMKGFFTLGPYQQQIENYIGNESRNLWEFPVRLKPEGLELLQAHLIELRQVEFTYYFQRYNCATLVKHVLAVAEPAILEHKDLWTTPKDVVRAAQDVGMLETANALIAARWTLRILSGGLDAAQIDGIKRDVEAFRLPSTGAADARQAFVARQAAEAYNHLLLREQLRSQADGLRYHRLLRQDRLPTDWQLETDQRYSPVVSPP